ncbi:MAG: nucleotidyltransferase family protein [Thermoanaerobaculia bacterium]|nr:nucleotidyltransferase family protein [Thermoanaerobaculia bacterium]
MTDAARDATLWLVAACRSWLGGPKPGPPPAEVGRMAFLHQLGPVLHDAARRGRLDLEGAPERVRRQWRETLFRNYIFNAELLAVGSALVREARDAGVPLAVFKGPVTAARSYGALELRIMADLDLLCREDDLGTVAGLAVGHGFRPAPQTGDYHLGFAHPDLGAGLELHFELYDRLAGGPALLEEILGRPDAVEIDGVALPAPPVEIALTLDLAHLVHHDYRLPLRSLLDLAAGLASTAAPADPVRLAAAVRRGGLEGELSRLLALFAETLAWPLPPPIARLAAPSGDLAGFAGPLLDRLASPGAPERRPLLGGPHSKGSAAATGRYLLRRLFPPLRRLQALYGTRTAAGALRHLPGHVARTLRRGLDRWRSGGLGSGPLRRGGR